MIQFTYCCRLVGIFLTVLVAALVIGSVPAVYAQDPAPTVLLKRVPIRQNGEVSGAKLFLSYCAACHGANGKGNGPAAEALKSIPPDLTMLSKFSGGAFPAVHVMNVLTGQGDNTAHGSKDMPIWGPLFRSMADQSTQGAYLRARNVTEYLRSIQER